MRVQESRLSAVVGSRSIAGVVLALAAVKGGAFRVTANVTLDDSSVITLADAGGAVKQFVDGDAVVSSLVTQKVMTGTDQVPVTYAGLTAIEPKPFTGDMLKRKARDLAAATKAKLSADETSARLTAEIAAFGSNLSAAEQAYKSEKQARLVSVDENRTFLAAEIVRLS